MALGRFLLCLMLFLGQDLLKIFHQSTPAADASSPAVGEQLPPRSSSTTFLLRSFKEASPRFLHLSPFLLKLLPQIIKGVGEISLVFTSFFCKTDLGTLCSIQQHTDIKMSKNWSYVSTKTCNLFKNTELFIQQRYLLYLYFVHGLILQYQGYLVQTGRVPVP